MPLECNDYSGVSVITIKGDLVADQASAMVETVAASGVRPNVVIDFEACRFFASVGLEALLKALHTCEDRGGRLMLSGLDENCLKILELTRLDHRFECHNQLSSALKAM